MQKNPLDSITQSPDLSALRNSSIPDGVVRQYRRRQDAFFDSLRVAESAPRFSLPSRRTLAGAMAMALIIITLAAVFSLNNTRSLYAQVVESLEKARSIHAVGLRLQDGQWVKSAEVWYDRDRGVVEREELDGFINIRIDDGAHQWRYTGRTQIAVKSKSADPLGAVREILDIETFQERLPVKMGIKTIDGIDCEVHARTYPEETRQMEMWFEPGAGRIHGWRKLRKTDGGEWQEYSKVKVEYDLPLDAARFSPDFGPEVAVIEGEKSWERRFDLASAIYTKEVLGLVFAVHEIRRCDEGLIFLVCSTRASDETLKELKPIQSHKGDGTKVYGDFQLDTSWKRFEDGSERSYQPLKIAHLYNDGLYVSWSFLIPKGAWPESATTCEIGAWIHTRDELEKKIAADGRKTYGRFSQMTNIPLPEEAASLTAVIDDVYHEVLGYEPIVFRTALSRASEPDPDQEGVRSTLFTEPSLITSSEYEQECRRELERLQ